MTYLTKLVISYLFLSFGFCQSNSTQRIDESQTGSDKNALQLKNKNEAGVRTDQEQITGPSENPFIKIKSGTITQNQLQSNQKTPIFQNLSETSQKYQTQTKHGSSQKPLVVAIYVDEPETAKDQSVPISEPPSSTLKPNGILTNQAQSGLKKGPPTSTLKPNGILANQIQNEVISPAQNISGNSSGPDPLDNACFVQTCSQTIMGRNLDYMRALHILQSEEYVTALTDEMSPVLTFNETVIRKRRQSTANIDNFFTLVGKNIKLFCEYIAKKGEVDFKYFITDYVTSYCGNYFKFCGVSCSPFTTPSLEALVRCNYKPTCLQPEDYLSFTAVDQCIANGKTHMIEITHFYCNLNPVSVPSYQQAETILSSVPLVFGIAGLAGMMALMQTEDLPLVSKRKTPPGSPSPGTRFGGGLPSKLSRMTVSALDLVPMNKTPVAVFPPFSKPRSIQAVGVIFSERLLPEAPPESNSMSSGRKKRSFHRAMRSYMRRNQRRPGFLSSIFYVMKLIRKKGKLIKKEMDYYKGLAKCFKSRLKMVIKGFKGPETRRRNSTTLQPPSTTTRPTPITTTTTTESSSVYRRMKRALLHEKEINSFEDCFDTPEPLYGFRVSITLVKDEPCILGETCRGQLILKGATPGKKKFEDADLTWRPVSEFSADGPQECFIRMEQQEMCQSVESDQFL